MTTKNISSRGLAITVFLLLLAILVGGLVVLVYQHWSITGLKKILGISSEAPAQITQLSRPELQPPTFISPTIINSPTPSTVRSHTAPSSNPTPTPTSALAPTPVPTQPPILAISPTSIPTPSPTQPPLLNGDFSQGLASWQTQGEVSVHVLDTTGANTSTPQPQSKFLVRLASATNLDWLGSHQLTQSFLSGPNVATLQFWYRLWTEETNFGFDDPALVVTIDDQVIWRVGAAAAWPQTPVWPNSQTPAKPLTTGWQLVSIPVAQLLAANNSHALKFIVGQSGDQAQATWTDLAAVTFLPAASTDEAQLTNPTWWPTTISLEWPQFMAQLSNQNQTTHFTGPLANLANQPNWTELLARLQPATFWQTHTLTDLLTTRSDDWRPLNWLVDATQLQPSFNFPFSLSHEGFTGLLTLEQTASNQLPGLQSPTPPFSSETWIGWDTIWNLLGKPEGLIWLDSGGQ